MKFTHIVFAIFLVKGPHCVAAAVPFLFRNVCPKHHCKRLGLDIRSSLNTTVNPCRNFYNFACDGWISKNQKPPSEIAWNHFRLAASRVNERLKVILENEESSTGASLRKAQTAYKSCMAEKNFLGALRLLIEVFGGWFPSSSANQTQHDWTINVIRATRITESYPIIKMHVGVDLQNTSRHILYIDPGQLNLPRSILMHPTANANTLFKYKQWILKTVKYLYPDRQIADLDRKINEIIQFEIWLTKLSSLQNRRRRITLKELSFKTGINWKGLINMLFAGINIRLTNEESVLYPPSYLHSLARFLGKIQSKEILTNYITWSIVRNLSRDTSRYMRILNFEMDEAVFGTQSDVPRSFECVSKVNEYLGSALIAKYAEKYLNAGAIQQAKHMGENIKSEYIAMLLENKWLSLDTKKSVIEKVLSVEFLIGFPQWMANTTLVNDFNHEAVVSGNHFLNVLNLKHLAVKRGLRQLIEPMSKLWWPINPFESNGFYYVLQNSIIVPLSLLEPPFFEAGRPAVFNYGALGSLMGHEISHALDTTGRQADKNGNVRRWWPSDDVHAYELKAECFAREYSKYAVDSSFTVDENIADNMGVLLSYRALKKQNLHVAIPHLDSYTYEQLFFITYSQLWCEIPDTNYNVLQEEHAPVYVRVLGTLSNSKEFRKSFGCLSNEVNYCDLW